MQIDLSARIHEWLGLSYKLHVQEIGEGPIIIMLHGIAASSMSWESLVLLLSKNYRCITIDLLGFGESPKPQSYSYTPKEHVASIRRTIKSLKLKDPYILMGHSLGALLGLHYASKYSEEINRLVMVSPPIYFKHPEITKTLSIWHHALYSKTYQYLRQNKNLTIKGAEKLRKTTGKQVLFELNEQTWLPFAKSLEESIEKQNVLADLTITTCPVEVFYGSLDQLLIKSNLERLSKFTNVNVHKVRSGHMIGQRYAGVIAETLLV